MFLKIMVFSESDAGGQLYIYIFWNKMADKIIRVLSGNFRLLLCTATNKQTKWWQIKMTIHDV